jgi:hypothetical protein
VYGYAGDDDPMNLVGAGYILLEKLAGKPSAWHEANEVQKEMFSRQLAEIYTSLEQHSLNGLGRLLRTALVYGAARSRTSFFDYDWSGNLIPFGHSVIETTTTQP